MAFPAVLDAAWYRLQRVAANLDGCDVADHVRALRLAREEGYGVVDDDGAVHLPEGGVAGAGRIVRPPSPHVILDDGTIKTRRQIDEEK